MTGKQGTEELLNWLRDIPDQALLTPEQIARRAEALVKRSDFSLEVIGKSSAGRDIQALHLAGAGPAILAWGFPHPDEPLGALALLAMCEAIADRGRPRGLEQAELWMVPVADPDQAALNSGWIAEGTLSAYLEGDWRPLYSGLEIDYQFPIMHPPFYQPRDRSIEGLGKPLRESNALADLIDRARPQLLGLMHSNHVSGAYTFLSHRPSSELIESFDLLNQSLGVRPHLGERPDPGRRWKTKRPDLLKEERLDSRKRKMERKFGSLEGKSLVGCVSAAQYLESLKPEALALTPEAGLWIPEEIDDRSLSGEKREVNKKREAGRERWYGNLPLGDGEEMEICYHTFKSQGEDREVAEETELTRGMAGVEAIELRRYFLSKADQIFEQAKPLLRDKDSPRLRERRAINVEGARVNDKSMLIFRADPSYRRPASKAEAQDLKLRWGMQTCLWLGHSLSLYREHGLEEAEERQAELLMGARQRLLPEIAEPLPDPMPAVRSQIGRLVLTYRSLSDKVKP